MRVAGNRLRGRLPAPYPHPGRKPLPGQYIATIDGVDWIVSYVRSIRNGTGWSYELERRARPREVEAWP
jgi:hypothetical protein